MSTTPCLRSPSCRLRQSCISALFTSSSVTPCSTSAASNFRPAACFGQWCVAAMRSPPFLDPHTRNPGASSSRSRLACHLRDGHLPFRLPDFPGIFPCSLFYYVCLPSSQTFMRDGLRASVPECGPRASHRTRPCVKRTHTVARTAEPRGGGGELFRDSGRDSRCNVLSAGRRTAVASAAGRRSNFVRPQIFDQIYVGMVFWTIGNAALFAVKGHPGSAAMVPAIIAVLCYRFAVAHTFERPIRLLSTHAASDLDRSDQQLVRRAAWPPATSPASTSACDDRSDLRLSALVSREERRLACPRRTQGLPASHRWAATDV